MRAAKKLFVLLTVLCLFCAFTLPAYAEAGEEYGYDVRIYLGREDIAGGGVVSKQNVKAGTQIGSDAAGVSLPEDSKYYVMGLREAGKDNNEGLQNVFTVDRDLDLVVAYGIKGDQVAYTVNYVLAGTGTQLHDPETFYGNIGDYMVVAYRYVEGYQPQAYNLGRTLSEDASANVFTFEYAPLTAPAPAAPAVDNAGGAVAVDGGAAPLAPAPAEIIDLDDTPLGLLDMGKDLIEGGATAFNQLPVAGRIGLILVDATLIALVVWLIVRNKRKKATA